MTLFNVRFGDDYIKNSFHREESTNGAGVSLNSSTGSEVYTYSIIGGDDASQFIIEERELSDDPKFFGLWLKDNPDFDLKANIDRSPQIEKY